MTARNAAILVWVLGLLSAFGPLSVDMYLPSMPAIGRDFGVDAGAVQLTLSAFFVGFAIGQLLYGPLSDRFGRRPLLMAGLALYVASSAMCALSPSIDTLVAFRLLHALGGGAGVVIARAIVRDRFAPNERARVLSLMMMVTSIAPLIAPVTGGYILQFFGWRAIFWTLTGFGALTLAAVAAALPETNPPAARRGVRTLAVFVSYGTVLRDPLAVTAMASGAFLFAGMFAYISGSPFVYIEVFGLPSEYYGYLFGVNILGITACSYINSRIAGRYGPERLMVVGAAVSTAAGAVLLFDAAAGIGGLAGIAVPLFFYVGPLGLMAANAIAVATENFPRNAGAVSALFGVGQFGIGAAAGIAVGQLHDDTALPMAAIMAGSGALALATAWMVHRGVVRPRGAAGTG